MVYWASGCCCCWFCPDVSCVEAAAATAAAATDVSPVWIPTACIILVRKSAFGAMMVAVPAVVPWVNPFGRLLMMMGVMAGAVVMVAVCCCCCCKVELLAGTVGRSFTWGVVGCAGGWV